jgi:hypothetical protein
VTESDPNHLDGASCTATLDTAAQTLTFVHTGWGATAEQKARSPVVIPLGAIESVEYERKRFLSWFRVLPIGVFPWEPGPATDPHGMVCSADPTDFAERVRSAVRSAKPATYDFVDEDDLPPPKRTWRGRFARGAARAVVDGFFTAR